MTGNSPSSTPITPFPDPPASPGEAQPADPIRPSIPHREETKPPGPETSSDDDLGLLLSEPDPFLSDETGDGVKATPPGRGQDAGTRLVPPGLNRPSTSSPFHGIRPNPGRTSTGVSQRHRSPRSPRRTSWSCRSRSRRVPTWSPGPPRLPPRSPHRCLAPPGGAGDGRWPPDLLASPPRHQLRQRRDAGTDLGPLDRTRALPAELPLRVERGGSACSSPGKADPFAPRSPRPRSPGGTWRHWARRFAWETLK